MNSNAVEIDGVQEKEPIGLCVFSSLYPNFKQPNAGVFIRERMSHVAQRIPLVVVSPVPWFPLQSLLRIFRPHYRPTPDYHEDQDGTDVYHPRFLALPGIGRRWDGLSMAVCSFWTIRRLRRARQIDILDSHFAFPDGYAASLLGRWLDMPFTVTLRGTELRMSRQAKFRKRMLKAMNRAACVITVSNSLQQVVSEIGAKPRKLIRVANGVDSTKFYPLPRIDVRSRFDLDMSAPVLISVGGLVPRKGFHRVIEVLPEILVVFPALQFLIVGGASAEGDTRKALEHLVEEKQLGTCVQFLGPLAPEELKFVLSAADIFVLATENEGWANVFLEAMACGIPVVTTRVGGNEEVVNSPELGTIVEFGDSAELRDALLDALQKEWDGQSIREHAVENSWNKRVDQLVPLFRSALPVTTD